MESQMAKELCKYLLAYKSLGFEWVVYEKTCTYRFYSFLKKIHDDKKNLQQNWKHVQWVDLLMR